MSKVKEFWNEHKGENIVYGGVATTVVASVGLWMLHVKKAYYRSPETCYFGNDSTPVFMSSSETAS